jgi:hypothetical protein
LFHINNFSFLRTSRSPAESDDVARAAGRAISAQRRDYQQAARCRDLSKFAVRPAGARLAPSGNAATRSLRA